MRTKTFNVGKYRRDVDTGTDNARADFFDSSNVAASEARRQSANLALNDLMDFLDGGGQVAILDATNSTSERRQMIVDKVTESGRKYRVLFVEVVCTDTEVLMTNMKNKVLHSPDFAGMSFEEGLADLMERVRKYEERYETIEDDSLSYLKLFNMSSKVLVNRIYGSIAQSLMPYMMGIHIGTRPIWLCRAGSVPVGKTQAAHLTESGRTFARKVGVFLERRLTEHFEGSVPDKPVRVLSSTVSSAVQTVLAMLNTTKKTRVLSFKQTSALNPIDRGKLSGSWWVDLCTHKPPFEELSRRDPATFAKWQGNKLRTRFPGGESYYDVMIRASSVLLEIEMATRPVLCVSHMTLLQVLLSYFQGTDVADAWDISIPENCLIEITPTLGGSFGVELIQLDNEVLDTPNIRPSKSRGRLTRDSYRSEEDKGYFSQDEEAVRKCHTLTADPLLFRRSVTPEASYQPHSEDDVFEKQRTNSR
jgi:6-phosphofructo-2-kinase/fructose-2,6-biphosphatase 1